MIKMNVTSRGSRHWFAKFGCLNLELIISNPPPNPLNSLLRGMNNTMNDTLPYDNWPLFIGNPNIPLEVRENIFAIALMTAIGSLFAVPGMISHYLKSRSSLALLALAYVVSTTLALFSGVFFEFTSKYTSLLSVYHNAVEVVFLLFAISKGSLKHWHLIVLGIHITLISLMILLLPSSQVGMPVKYSFLAFGIAGLVVDILAFSMWTLVLLENRRNPGSGPEGPRCQQCPRRP